MSKATFTQNSFGLGEVSPRALGRFDADKPIWKQGVAKLENFMNHKVGGAFFANGTQYIASAKQSNAPVRLEPFKYSISQQYILELGNQYMRFFANKGQVVVSAGAPLDANTILLSHFDGTNGQATYTAETGQTISFFGSAQLDTAVYKFGPSSLRLDGVNSYVSLPDAPGFNFGTGATTWETFVQFSSTASPVDILGQEQDANNFMSLGYFPSGAQLFWKVVVAGTAILNKFESWTPTVGVMYHIMAVRTGNNFHLYINAVEIGSVTTTSITLPDLTGNFVIGHNANNYPNYFNGWIDEVRISNVARTVVVPTNPYGGATAWVTSHGYVIGDFVSQGGLTYICLLAHTSGTFATDLAAGDWSAQQQLEIATPFAQADLFSLQFANKADVCYIVDANYHPQKLTRLSATSFSIANVNFIRGPFLDQNITTTTITPSAATGASITLTASTSIFKVGHIGALFRINSAAGVGACVKITAFTSGTVVTGDVQAEPDGTAGNIGGTGAYTNWAEGAFSTVQGWPVSVVFHEQRLVYGGALGKPGKFYASNTGAYDNFNVGGNGFGTATDSNSYSYEPGTDEVCAIRWLASAATLQIGTSGGTFTAQGGTAGITPTNIQVNPDTNYVVYPARPRRISNYLYYLSGSGFILNQLVFNLYFNQQEAEDITMLADHILRDGGGAFQMANQQSPSDRLWVARNDGQLAILTRDAKQQIMAWARRIPGATAFGAGLFESVASLTQDSNDDQIWVSVQRNVNGTVYRFIEIFTPEFFTNVWDSINVDCCLAFNNPVMITGATKALPCVITAPSHGFSNGNQVKIEGVVGMTQLNGNQYLVQNVATNTFSLTTLLGVQIDSSLFSAYVTGGNVRKMAQTFSGLSYLNGEYVKVQADGVDIGTFLVSGGAITINRMAAVVYAGLPYSGSLQLLPLGDGSPLGTGQTKYRKVYLSALRVYRSLGGTIGFVDNNGNLLRTMTDLDYAKSELAAAPDGLYTGDVEQIPDSDFTKFASVLIQQTKANPLFILSAIIQNEEQEK